MSATAEDINLFGEPDDAGLEAGEAQDTAVDDGSLTLEVDADGNPIGTTDGDDPDDAPEGGTAAKPAKTQTDDDADVVKIKKSEWEQFQREQAELRGFITARKSEPSLGPDPSRGVQSQPQRAPEADLETQLDALSERAYDDLLSGDPNRAKGAIKNILKVGAQAGFNNAKAIFGTMAPLQAQTIIDNFASRKQRNDPLYDRGVGELFDNLLSEYDTSVLVGQPREVVQKTLDTMYQKAKGDFADRMYAEGESRKAVRAKQGNSNPPNLGGGRSGSAQGGRTMKIPPAWVKWAQDAGIPQEEMADTFATMLKNQRGAE